MNTPHTVQKVMALAAAILLSACAAETGSRTQGAPGPDPVIDGVQASSTRALTSETDGGIGVQNETETDSSGVCTDRDHDGRGPGCSAGPDCDDTDPGVTDQCTRCIRPAEGCACQGREQPLPCGVRVEGVCQGGIRSCEQGRWTDCRPYRRVGRLLGLASQCENSCDPTCRHIVDCPAIGDALPPGASNIEYGTLSPAVFCPSSATAGGVTPTCETTAGGPYLRVNSPRPWIDACAQTGSQTLLANADEGTVDVAIPFAFSFYGVPYTSATVSANGYISFATGSPQWVNSMLPSSEVPNTIFAFWDDLVQRDGVCTATVGTAPDRAFVIQWHDAGFYPTPQAATHLDFEVVLDERLNTIDVRFNQMEGEGDRSTGGSATVGVQQGSGSSYDLVAYDTPGVTRSDTGFRWAPSNNSTRCPRAVWSRVYEGDCAAVDPYAVAIWGALNYTAQVPVGGAVHFTVRAAVTRAELATAPVMLLPDAPRGSGATPNSIDLGAFLRVAQPGLERASYVELTAYLDPGAFGDAPPTLGSTEVQFSCLPLEAPTECRPGAACFTAGPCRRGQVACANNGAVSCVDAGPLPAGSACGDARVCDATGTCVACQEGAACETGNACETGRISCATGAAVCVPSGNRPAGTVCSVGPGNYTRGTSAYGWLEACEAAGHTEVLANVEDGTEAVVLPFPFRFYGTPRTTAMVSSNGVFGFGSLSAEWTNTDLAATAMGDAIFPFWDDLSMRRGVCLATFGTAPDRLFVAQWSQGDFQDRGNTGNTGASINFEVVLEEASQSISVIYGPMTGDARATGTGATVGLQSADGVHFDRVGFNTAGTVVPNGSIRWRPPIDGICTGMGVCETCSTTEVCDGRDNNCNALIDDGIADQSCGVGACRRTVPGCLRGAVPACVPGAPLPEACNGIDDDCDGVTDEGCNGSIACPRDLTINAGDTVSLSATATGTVSNYLWTVVSGPTGGATSTVWAPAPPRARTESITPYIVGVYRVRVTATDGVGSPLACEFNLTAQGHGIRVELTWNGTGDLDLHLHNSNATRAWYSSADTFYSNMRSAFGAALDVDNVVSYGPENIRVDTPIIGETYTVAVHNYYGGAGRRATVRVYCGAGTVPVATYLSNVLSGSSAGNCTGNTFWRVARITADPSGGCTLSPLDTYSTSSNACSTF